MEKKETPQEKELSEGTVEVLPVEAAPNGVEAVPTVADVGDIMSCPPEEFERAMKVMEQAPERYRRIFRVAAHFSYPGDWLLIEGNPYLTGGGATRIAAGVGISIRNVRMEEKWYQDEKGPWYEIRCIGTASFRGGRSITVIGNCSSRKKFFWVKRDEFRPLYEISKEFIERAAYTDLFRQAVVHLLGLKGLTAKQLEELGFKPKEFREVRWTSTKKESATPEKLKRIGELILKKVGGDKSKAEAELERLTTWKKRNGETVQGKKHLKELSEKQADIILERLEKEALDQAFVDDVIDEVASEGQGEEQ